MKKVIVTSLNDLLIKNKAFIDPHKAWFDRAIKKTKDRSLAKWKGRKDYFLGVNESMDKIMPKATKKQKISKAREWYQKDVIKYIRDHPKVINIKLKKKLESLKKDFKLVLLTTNTKDYIKKILKVSKLTKLYDQIIASKTSEEPNKLKLIKKLKKPSYYLTGKKEPEVIKQFKKLKVKIIAPSDLGNL